MKDLLKTEYRELRNRIMLLVLSALTVIAGVSMLKDNLVDQLASPELNAGYNGGFGAELIKVDDVIAREFGVPAEGIIINRVHPNTIAAGTGLKRRDIIVSLNGSAINSVSTFKSLLFSLDFNNTVKLTVLRDNQEITVTVPSGWSSHPLSRQPTTGSYKNYITASAIFIVVFSLLFLNVSDRIVVITLGAVLMVIAGGYAGFYSPEAAFGSIKLNVLSLLLGLNLITIVLEKAGFFEYLSNRVLVFSGNDVQRVTITFCVVSYLLSAFVNNLTTIMVLLPVSLSIIKNLPIDPKKFLFCVITASNLGGASTMIGDFPNMLISSAKEIMFHDFLFNMAPVTALLMVIMLFYFGPGMISGESSSRDIEKLIENAKNKLNTSIKDYAAVSRGVAVLAILIVGFILSDTIHIPPSAMAIAGGFFLLLFEAKPSNIFKDVCFKDIIFFCSLFVLVGGLHGAGILENIAYWMAMASGESSFFKLVIIMLLAALFTSFLNAGPSTALFIPIVASIAFSEGSNIAWWALSIGVCIGSSATLTGATAGPVAMTI